MEYVSVWRIRYAEFHKRMTDLDVNGCDAVCGSSEMVGVVGGRGERGFGQGVLQEGGEGWWSCGGNKNKISTIA